MPQRAIHFVSLGCPKNRVDSEVMLGVALGGGFEHVDDPTRAEVIVEEGRYAVRITELVGNGITA